MSWRNLLRALRESGSVLYIISRVLRVFIELKLMLTIYFLLETLVNSCSYTSVFDIQWYFSCSPHLTGTEPILPGPEEQERNLWKAKMKYFESFKNQKSRFWFWTLPYKIKILIFKWKSEIDINESLIHIVIPIQWVSSDLVKQPFSK